jgi:hypothetical protein
MRARDVRRVEAAPERARRRIRVQEHVGMPEQTREEFTPGAIAGVHADSLLAAVPDAMAAVPARGRQAAGLDHDDAGAVVREEHPGDGRGDASVRLDDHQLVERPHQV